ncbi:hypothetical protein JHK82_014198 [Glycine max]|nr:hypothetical protein JHK85_014572 [Glycine max]KAG5147317.1 hypothetical protein JHK82_014198 [Glycine max]
MDLLRSEPMQLVQLIIPIESAHRSISYLGDLGLIQFKDVRIPFNSHCSRFRFFYLALCGEMARRLRLFKEQMTKAGVSPSTWSTRDNHFDLEHLEVKLEELEAELLEINANNEKLQHTYNELLEYKLVLEKVGEFFSSAKNKAVAQQKELEFQTTVEGSIDSPLLLEQEETTTKQIKLRFISGLVHREKSIPFERIIFRATRGNVFLKQAVIQHPVLDPLSGEKVSGRLSELKTTIDAGLIHRSTLLQTIGYHYEQWSLQLKKEKSIYHTLNMLSINVTKKCLLAEGWCPVFATSQIHKVLERATMDCSSQVGAIFQVLETKESPPTYFSTNKFTSSFQEIVDAYGIAKYQEANPGVYTIVTFPFLFAVMFGDWGHGICLLLAALYLIIREKKFASQKLGDIMEMAFGGRYIIMLMALFSIYTGLIYNEFFSVPFELFGPSAYGCRDSSCRDASTTGFIKVRSTYPFGVDPKWHGTRSELPFLNSLKMKMSILLGVSQMNLGIIMSYFNAKYFENNINIWYQFVPQIIFLNSLFGYLSLLIIIKWSTGSQADLYHVMIYMFLSPTDDLGENQLFVGQKLLQRHQGQSYDLLYGTDDPLESESQSIPHDEFDFSEVFVHQLIHTIEFVLGAVSNTASYLRLWALSLAHSELSSVFYDKVLLLAWGYNSTIVLIVGIFVFICATVGVLLLMESLSAFLHALRLHWVEYQNKFYEGDGYKFFPFSFTLLTDEDEL